MRPHRPQYGGGRGRFGVCMIVRAYRQTHGGENLMKFPNMTVDGLVERRFVLLQHLMMERNPEQRRTIRRAMILMDNELLHRRGYCWGPSDYQVTDRVMLATATRLHTPCGHDGCSTGRCEWI